MYKTNRYEQDMKRMGEDANLLSLNNEVKLLKAMIQEKLNLIQDDHSASLYSAAVADLIFKCEKLVTSCQRLNDKLNLSMTAEQAMGWAGQIVDIIAQEVKDADTLERIKARIDEARQSARVQRSESDI